MKELGLSLNEKTTQHWFSYSSLVNYLESIVEFG